MVDPLVIEASVAVGASLGTLALRDVFARATIKKACRNAEPDIEKFKKDNTYVVHLKERFQAAASVLYETISQSREMRDQHIATAKELVIPNPDIPLELDELQRTLMDNQKQFLAIMKNTYVHKARNLFVDQIHYKLNFAKEFYTRIADAAAAATAAGHGLFADDIAQIYLEVQKELAPQLDAVEQEIVNTLDQTGVLDFTAEAIDKAHNFVIDHIGTAAVQHLEHTADFLSFLHHLPGGGAMISTGLKEFQLLRDGEIDLDDSLGNIATSFVVRAPLIKVGMILDGLTGGASLGGFTVLFNFISKKATNAIQQEEIDNLKREFERLKAEIEAARWAALRAINKVAGDLQKLLAQKIEDCPDINEEASLVSFIESLRDACNIGFRNSEEKLSKNTRIAIAGIPENTWLEKILFVDRRKAVEKLYLEAQRSISSHHSGLVHNFSIAVDAHAEDAIQFMIEQVMFDEPQMDLVLGQLESVTEISAAAYEGALSVWQEDTQKFHEQATNTVNQVTEQEMARFNAMAEARKASMKSIRRRISVLERRQGKTPAPQAA